METSFITNKDNKPEIEDILKYINNNLADKLLLFIEDTYKIKPRLEYCTCKLDDYRWDGWSLKFKKNGKSIVNIYPQPQQLWVMIQISTFNLVNANTIIGNNDYLKEVYKKAKLGYYGKSLVIEIKDNDIMEVIKQLIELRINA